jgi:hypothetical protein
MLLVPSDLCAGMIVFLKQTVFTASDWNGIPGDTGIQV